LGKNTPPLRAISVTLSLPEVLQLRRNAGNTVQRIQPGVGWQVVHCIVIREAEGAVEADYQLAVNSRFEARKEAS
jgi:hypothetical protein